jgi:hypothetical protein
LILGVGSLPFEGGGGIGLFDLVGYRKVEKEILG